MHLCMIPVITFVSRLSNLEIDIILLLSKSSIHLNKFSYNSSNKKWCKYACFPITDCNKSRSFYMFQRRPIHKWSKPSIRIALNDIVLEAAVTGGQAVRHELPTTSVRVRGVPYPPAETSRAPGRLNLPVRVDVELLAVLRSLYEIDTQNNGIFT